MNCCDRQELTRADVHSKRSEWLLGLRFVAAVSVSCSGDKSDKEESAGRFAMLWGFCVTAAVVDWQSVRLNDDSQRKYVDFPEMT